MLSMFIKMSVLFEQRHLLKDYGEQKNHLKRMCTGDYIFNLDADELPNKSLITNIKPLKKVFGYLVDQHQHGWSQPVPLVHGYGY